MLLTHIWFDIQYVIVKFTMWTINNSKIYIKVNAILKQKFKYIYMICSDRFFPDEI